ncbi:MAG: hypothetical protein M1814_001941 [Vezdaea aestivalis]|nr:MAG: hypothetical protein M1814_001941 [Vezdaea aestivalis]
MASHSYGPTCRLLVPQSDPDQRHSRTPPRLKSHFFYTSAFALDDPLSPVPPATAGPASKSKKAPRPFSIYDNAALEEAWAGLWRTDGPDKARQKRESMFEHRPSSSAADKARSPHVETGLSDGFPATELASTAERFKGDRRGATPKDVRPKRKTDSKPEEPSPKSLTPTYGSSPMNSDITGMPFLRAPSRDTISRSSLVEDERQPRPKSRGIAKATHVDHLLRSDSEPPPEPEIPPTEDTIQVPVGVSRLHLVNMPSLQIKPIYWSPLHDDVATAWRGTWYYRKSMLPVEANLANQLEKGYVELAPWSETWDDELNSAIEVGADGEARVMYTIWPKEAPQSTTTPKDSSRPSTSSGVLVNATKSSVLPQYDHQLNSQISVSAEGVVDLAKVNTTKAFPDAGVFYANSKDAYILRPKQLPSAYYNRRPILSTRRGKPAGVHVVRGFDWRAWEKIHPSNVTAYTMKAQEGAALSQSGTASSGKRELCEVCSAEENRQLATDLILVIHGIGQKLSERVESFHFTHAMNAFRREMNVELVSDPVRKHLRPDFGGVMVLPVNWRSTLSFEEGGHRGTEDPHQAADSSNSYSLKDITPTTIPAVRNLVNEVMSDVPYYLSHHRPKMIQAVVNEANRIYNLWCKNNPSFHSTGKVHLIAHSLGAAMALDILSNQPTTLPPTISGESHFAFDTKSLFFCGSPAGFFLLLNRGTLLPRKGRSKPGSDSDEQHPGVAGSRGTYGCLAVDNLYNILSLNDPIAYQLNAIVDAEYASSLRPALIPVGTQSLFTPLTRLFSTPAPLFGPPSSSIQPGPPRPSLASSGRLASTVEMATHDFSREELAERRFSLLNDNQQLDYFLGTGGGPLEIQYLNMLSAHSSYWVSRDFVRFVVIEVGRQAGKEGALPVLRARRKERA